jgi:hypothetical protein
MSDTKKSPEASAGRAKSGGETLSMKKAAERTSNLPDDRSVIPPELATEMRRLAHDLSNALEIIVQTSYLLSTVELGTDGRQWLGLLDKGVHQATDINRELRQYIRDHI